MNETSLRMLQMQFGGAPTAAVNLNRYLAELTRKLYNRASASAWRQRIWANITRKSDCLLSLHAQAPTRQSNNGYFAGIRAVALNDIRGSENRSCDFNGDFAPLQKHSRDRWMSVAMARLRGTPLPPVQLIQLGNIYYVRDGHHRISVARALGETAIDAEVTVWQAQQAATQPLPLAQQTALLA